VPGRHAAQAIFRTIAQGRVIDEFILTALEMPAMLREDAVPRNFDPAYSLHEGRQQLFRAPPQ